MTRKFPAITETLEEARLMFQYEQQRFQGLENKATSFLSLNALVFAILALISTPYKFLYVPVFITLAISILFTFRVFALRTGAIPHASFDDYFDYARMSKMKAKDEFLLNYTQVLKKEHDINEDKVEQLRNVVLWSKISWILFVAVLLIQVVLIFCPRL